MGLKFYVTDKIHEKEHLMTNLTRVWMFNSLNMGIELEPPKRLTPILSVLIMKVKLIKSVSYNIRSGHSGPNASLFFAFSSFFLKNEALHSIP